MPISPVPISQDIGQVLLAWQFDIESSGPEALVRDEYLDPYIYMFPVEPICQLEMLLLCKSQRSASSMSPSPFDQSNIALTNPQLVCTGEHMAQMHVMIGRTLEVSVHTRGLHSAAGKRHCKPRRNRVSVRRTREQDSATVVWLSFLLAQVCKAGAEWFKASDGPVLLRSILPAVPGPECRSQIGPASPARMPGNKVCGR